MLIGSSFPAVYTFQNFQLTYLTVPPPTLESFYQPESVLTFVCGLLFLIGKLRTCLFSQDLPPGKIETPE